MIKSKYHLLLLCIFFAPQVFAADELIPDKSAKAASLVQSAATGGTNGLSNQLQNEATNFFSGQANSLGKDFLSKYFPTSEFSLGLGDPSKPTFGALVVMPISDRDNVTNTVFGQGSIYHFDDRTTINMGLGYRRLVNDNRTLLGINGFFDNEFPYNHQRSSIGLEARTTIAEINTNRYWGISGWKNVSGGYEERALGGYDIELGVALPYMPWAKVYTRTFEWYALEGAENLRGNDYSVRAAIPTLPGFVVEAGRREYQTIAGSTFLRISYVINEKSRNQQGKQFFAETAYALKNMEQYRYDKVRRENLIVKQKRSRFKVNFVAF
jgi:adhesin/invasin